MQEKKKFNPLFCIEAYLFSMAVITISLTIPKSFVLDNIALEEIEEDRGRSDSIFALGETFVRSCVDKEENDDNNFIS
jgi:hypothetical protein